MDVLILKYEKLFNDYLDQNLNYRTEFIKWLNETLDTEGKSITESYDEVARSQVFNSQDKLTFSYSVPAYIDNANLVNTTGSLFGESNHTEKIHNINKYEVLEIYK